VSERSGSVSSILIRDFDLVAAFDGESDISTSSSREFLEELFLDRNSRLLGFDRVDLVAGALFRLVVEEVGMELDVEATFVVFKERLGAEMIRGPDDEVEGSTGRTAGSVCTPVSVPRLKGSDDSTMECPILKLHNICATLISSAV